MTTKNYLIPLFLMLLVIIPYACNDNSSEDLSGEYPSVHDDPLVRMPGTHPTDNVQLNAPTQCFNCHAGYDATIEPGFNWKGSMMAQASRDFLFWSCFTVAAQDSIWAVGRPNAVDICERCHFPEGWLEGRSDPPNASSMIGSDFDGVSCDVCHNLYDPFFEDTSAGTREGSDWESYWDEANVISPSSAQMAEQTLNEDRYQSTLITKFDGLSFYGTDNKPFSKDYTESASGQMFIGTGGQLRASFADTKANHQMLYSRYHKSKYICGTCHDVSNPILANIDFKDSTPDSDTILNSEKQPAYSYFHVERTFSEFILSAYGQQGGSKGNALFAPEVFETSHPDNAITTCQDCHLPDVTGAGSNRNSAKIRPTNSSEHPQSGLPLHDMTGGNAWVSQILASAITGSSNYDSFNAELLNQGAEILTLDLNNGEGIDPEALLAGAERAIRQLTMAASITEAEYSSTEGTLSFKIVNNTGHKLISGFPEGRRMFLNIQLFDSTRQKIYEINPYDNTTHTLKGLNTNYSPDSPSLSENEKHLDELVYEMHPKSDLTGEEETFHFALATGRYKDNRIPPKGFRIEEASIRQSEPVWHGESSLDYYTAEEYAGGYDQITLNLPVEANEIQINLFYQTTSREYIAFLRDEINGNDRITLPETAYVIQSNSFFTKLKAWGETLWKLWDHNVNIKGAEPVLIAEYTIK